MPRIGLNKTKYAGVYWKDDLDPAGKKCRIYYIIYRRAGESGQIEEKVSDYTMTPYKAFLLRADKIKRVEPTNQERREASRKKKWTFNDLWKKFEETVELKSMRTVKGLYKNHIKKALGEKIPAKLQPLDLERLRKKVEKGHSPATTRYVLGLVRRLANFGRDSHLCAGLTFRVRMPKVDNAKTEDLSPAQLKRLKKVLDEYPDTIEKGGRRDSAVQIVAIMRMALFTGMRRGEILALKWEHVDFRKGFIKIVSPKSGQTHEIPLNIHARRVLKNHPRADSEYVFPGAGGKQRSEVKYHLQEIKKRAKLPKDFRPLHGLRHHFASALASSGRVDMYALQRMLGHKTPAMTQRYAHLRDEAMKAAAKVADEVIGG